MIIHTDFNSEYLRRYVPLLKANYGLELLPTIIKKINDSLNLGVSYSKTKLSSIKNEIILIDSYTRELPVLKNCKIYLFSYDGNISGSMALPYLTGVIVPDVWAFRKAISCLVRSNSNKPVYILPPYVDPDEFMIPKGGNTINCIGDHPGISHKAVVRNSLTSDNIKSSVCTLITTYCGMLPILKSNLGGRPIISTNSPQFINCISNNGFLLNNWNEFEVALNKAVSEDTYHYCVSYARSIVNNCINTLRAIISEDYIAEHTPQIDLGLWYIPYMIMSDLESEIVPKIVDPRYKEAKAGNIIEILDFFSKNFFREVYVFDYEHLEYSSLHANRIRKQLNLLGPKARKIHFCVDYIDDKWDQVFDLLSVMSVAEGERQVRYA